MATFVTDYPVTIESATGSKNASNEASFQYISEELFIKINIFISTTVIAIALIGVVLNALNIKTFIMMGLKDGVTVTFLTLAISDFCGTASSSIQSSARLCVSLEKRYDLWFSTDPFIIDLFSNSCAILCNTVTALTTAFIAIARCMCVASPFKFKNMFTRTRCLLTFVVFVLCILCFFVPIFANMGVAEKYFPEKNASRFVLWLSKDREKIKDVAASIIFLPLSVVEEIIIVVCVLIMASKLRESVRFRQKDETKANSGDKDYPTKLTGKERSVVLQVVTISVIFIVCNLSKMIHALLMNTDPNYEVGKSGHYFYVIFASVRVIFDNINATVNFFVYFFFNSKFRSLCFKCKSQ